MIIDSLIARDRSQPTGKCFLIPQAAQALKREQEHILDNILHFRMRDAREEQAMNHAGILLIKLPERNAASLAGLLNQRASRLFRAIYWRKECDNALHMILATWKDEGTGYPLTARAVNGLHAGVKQPVGLSMLGWTEARSFPAAKGQRDVRAGSGRIDLQDAGVDFG